MSEEEHRQIMGAYLLYYTWGVGHKAGCGSGTVQVECTSAAYYQRYTGEEYYDCVCKLASNGMCEDVQDEALENEVMPSTGHTLQ